MHKFTLRLLMPETIGHITGQAHAPSNRVPTCSGACRTAWRHCEPCIWQAVTTQVLWVQAVGRGKFEKDSMLESLDLYPSQHTRKLSSSRARARTCW